MYPSPLKPSTWLVALGCFALYRTVFWIDMGVLQEKDNTHFTLQETLIPRSCCHKHYSEEDDVEQLGLVKITSRLDDLILLFIGSNGYIISLGFHVLLIL